MCYSLELSSVCACQQQQLAQQSHQIGQKAIFQEDALFMYAMFSQTKCNLTIFYQFALQLKVFARLYFSCVIISQGECFRLYTFELLMKVRDFQINHFSKLNFSLLNVISLTKENFATICHKK